MHDYDDFDEFEPDDRRTHMYGYRRPQVPTWNGQHVQNLEPDHLVNAILYCEKKFAEAKINHDTCFPMGNDPFYFESVYEMFPDYKHLRDEWNRRNHRRE